MLELRKIKKVYFAGQEKVKALRGVSLKFRKSEFVSILGASGCGKTTLLNIIGGLDKYTSGDLIIEGKSTKEYTDRDWDTYRNHSIGFIFQSYHLIPHQTILQNVELALTIAGVSKKQRRQRAIDALARVGLADKINNLPNQLSGGQAQRVAIARALINDPEILLADEPTGALDSKTSVQIMELLKEIAKDRLVIMVTHNPELAEQYSTRIIRLLDGKVIGDTMPYDGEVSPVKELTAGKIKDKGKKKNSSMSMGMSFSLSLKNLLSKRKRTAMVSVAGSIGIVGVSLVLAVSAGVTSYIDSMQDDMLSGYPVSITQSAIDYSSLMDMNKGTPSVDIPKIKEGDKLYVNSLMKTLGTFSTGFSKTNKITEAYIDYVEKMPEENYNVLQYGYGFDIANNIYTDFFVDEYSNIDGTYTDASGNIVTDESGSSAIDASGNLSVTAIRAMYTQILSEQEEYKDWAGTISTVATFDELPDNYNYILSQYDIIATDIKTGEEYKTDDLTTQELEAIFKSKESLIMVVNKSEVTDLIMGQFGYLTEREFLNYAYAAVENDMYDEDLGILATTDGIKIDKFVGESAKKFTWYPNNQVYSYNSTTGWSYNPYSSARTVVYSDAASGITYPVQYSGFDDDSGVELSVKIILQKKSDISYGCLDSGFYYTNELTKYVLEQGKNSDIVNYINTTTDAEGNVKGYIDRIPYFFNYSSFEKTGEMLNKITKTGSMIIYSSGGIMNMLMGGLSGESGGVNTKVTAAMVGGDSMPTSIYVYPVDFDTKSDVTAYLDAWNDLCADGVEYTYTVDGVEKTLKLDEQYKISYTDTVGLIISMVNVMIQMITTALIVFTALSLVVSTVMIGIITYVSVVERIKEIGILRAVGARKKDIKRLFNAETFIIGLTSGIIGILTTYLLSGIINVIVGSLAGIWTIASLPLWQAGVMILVSVVLTSISGLIPASSAAKKDPVIALRTE